MSSSDANTDVDPPLIDHAKNELQVGQDTSPQAFQLQGEAQTSVIQETDTAEERVQNEGTKWLQQWDAYIWHHLVERTATSLFPPEDLPLRKEGALPETIRRFVAAIENNAVKLAGHRASLVTAGKEVSNFCNHISAGLPDPNPELEEDLESAKGEPVQQLVIIREEILLFLEKHIQVTKENQNFAKKMKNKDSKIHSQAKKIRNYEEDVRNHDAKSNEARKVDMEQIKGLKEELRKSEQENESLRTELKDVNDKKEANKAIYVKHLQNMKDKVKALEQVTEEEKQKAATAELDYEAVKQQRDEQRDEFDTEIIQLRTAAEGSQAQVALLQAELKKLAASENENRQLRTQAQLAQNKMDQLRAEMDEVNVKLLLQIDSSRAEDDRIKEAVNEAMILKDAEIRRLENQNLVLDQARICDELNIRELSQYKVELNDQARVNDERTIQELSQYKGELNEVRKENRELRSRLEMFFNLARTFEDMKKKG